MSDGVDAVAQPVHDLGGRAGFGPVPVDDDAIFHADWEARAFAVTNLSAELAGFNTDAFRHGIEREDPDLYIGMNYFEKWIRNGERMLVEGGVLPPDAVPSRLAATVSTGTSRRTTDALPRQGPTALRDVGHQPRFGIGEAVRVRADYKPHGHTRLPGYVRGRPGVIDIVNDGWVYPDTHAHGLGEQPTWVYAVRFESTDLWPEDPGSHAVFVDLFEPYLEPA